MSTRLSQIVITAEEMVPSSDEGTTVPNEGEPRRCPIIRKQYTGLVTPRYLMSKHEDKPAA